MTKEAVAIAADHGEARDSIFDLVLKNREHFLSQVGGLPDIHGFLQVAAEPLRGIFIRRWQQYVSASRSPLVVNILINPTLFFCHKQAVQGQYRKYFRPVYLDENALHIDGCDSEGCGQTHDFPAQAIVELHNTFDEHYQGSFAARPFLSLNDIEALLNRRAPLPAANEVISIWHEDDGTFAMVADTDNSSSYLEKIQHILTYNQRVFEEKGVPDATDRFSKYLAHVTRHGGSYHHVTIGSDEDWVARVYIAFREKVNPVHTPEWIRQVKDFAFVISAPMALAGTFLRNPAVIGMIEEVRALLDRATQTHAHHRSIFHQFSETAAQQNRKKLPIKQQMGNEIGTIAALPGFSRVRSHIASANCGECRADSDFKHTLDRCQKLGNAFLDDITSIVATLPEFKDVPTDTVKYIGRAMAFGLTEHDMRPKGLRDYFTQRGIPAEWITECLAMPDSDCFSVGTVLPYLRALLLMAGNRRMAETNANRLGVRLGDCSLKPLIPHDGGIIAQVVYGITGDLNEEGRYTLDLQAAGLHEEKNRLLAHFGAQFLDDFRMYICTSARQGHRIAQYHWFEEEISPSTDSITYSFRFSASRGD